MLLHYSGTGRRVADGALSDFFAGHWLYYKGTTLTHRVGASLSRVKLHVKDTSVFSLRRHGPGVADDIAIAPVGMDGKTDWTRAEQVRLRSINDRKKTITVERAAYGTRPLSFPAGSYLAAHVISPPVKNEIIWNYNLSTVGPRDAQGRSCGEVLVDYLVERLGPGGDLESFDGIELDVLGSVVRIGGPLVDVDTDGEADGGVVDGVNVVNLGVLEFTKALRERLPEKIITADGHKPWESQRSFGDMNGIETEGYPTRVDVELDHLSTGENIFRFWKDNSTAPSWSYMNFKYEELAVKRRRRSRNTFVEPNLSEDRSYQKLRLALASAQFVDAAFTYSKGWTPPPTRWKQGSAMVQVFDELWRGVDQKPNWLGMPVGPDRPLGH